MENIRWFGHASFAITDENGNKVYFIDPFELPEMYEKADLVFVTHAHHDHLSEGDIRSILKPETVVVATSDSLATLDITDSQKFNVTPNQEFEIKGLKFETVPAYNVHPARQSFHPKSNNWVGYIINVNGLRIYHAGDCDFMPEMNDFASKNIDIALLPIGGQYTMDVEEAIAAADAIKAKTTIPIHYKRILADKAAAAEERFKSGVKNTSVAILAEIE